MYVRKNNCTNLTLARQEKGMSREQLAEKTGISDRTIEKYEQGIVSINNAAVWKVRDLAHALGVSIESILENE